MATIVKRDNGNYLIRVSNGKGNIINRTFSPSKGITETQAFIEAQEFAEKLEYAVKTGQYDPAKNDNVRFEDFIKKFFKSSENRFAPYTLRLYREFAESTLIPSFGNLYLDEINDSHLQALVDYLNRPGARKDGKSYDSLQPETIRRYVSAFNTIMHEAYCKGLISKPAFREGFVKLPKVYPKTQETYDTKELNLFMKCLDKEKPPVKALLATFVLTGMRRGEVVALKWSDVDFDDKTIIVNKAFYKDKGEEKQIKNPKSANGVRTIPISDRLISMLLELREYQEKNAARCVNLTDDGFIFINLQTGDAIGLYTPRKIYQSFVKKHDLKKLNLKALRHTFCSQLIENGESPETVKELAGHGDIKTTFNYVHAYDASKRDAVEKLTNKIINK